MTAVRAFIERNLIVKTVLVSIIALSFLFQIGHFVEHVAEVYMWTFVDHSQIYMSPIAMHLEMGIAERVVPGADMAPSIIVGKEILHLIGDLIFLTGILSFWILVSTRLTRAALYLELYHTYEHISLAITVYYLNRPIGLSTFFGAPVPLHIVFGYRVYWHFFMNLIPMILVSIVLMRLYRIYKARRTGSQQIQMAL